MTRLTEVDMQAWEHQGFHCEHQGGLRDEGDGDLPEDYTVTGG
ncbi:hypothetical protein [Nostoc sp. 'Peltigera malacea cyanobiont' DB3992]|nr:hypothetical protein [Nostoc sp. 'Peltigera malacea cyanobiont' DB3992]